MSNDASHTTDVPEAIARLMDVQTFDISQTRIEDFREAAQRSAGQRLQFALGKPAGMAQGLALLTRKDTQLRANLIIRRTGKMTKYVLPTVEFAEPELQPFLEPVHLIPIVDVTTSTPAAYLWPFRITAWDGYETVFSALAALEDTTSVLYVRYLRGGGNDPGGYTAQALPMEDRHRELWRGVEWPRDIYTLIPAVPFADLLAESFNIKLAWAESLARRSPAA